MYIYVQICLAGICFALNKKMGSKVFLKKRKENGKQNMNFQELNVSIE